MSSEIDSSKIVEVFKLLLDHVTNDDFLSISSWNEKLEDVISSKPFLLFPPKVKKLNDEEIDTIISSISICANFLRIQILIIIVKYTSAEGKPTNNDIGNQEIQNLCRKISNEPEFFKIVSTDDQDRMAKILRTIKNVARCYNHCTMLYGTNIKLFFQQKENSTGGPLANLQTDGMISLYLVLMDSFSMDIENASEVSLSVVKESSGISLYSCHALFHFTYGSNGPGFVKARSIFTKSLNGIPVLMKLMIYPSFVPQLAMLSKIIHHMLGSDVTLLEQMNLSLKKMEMNRWCPSVFLCDSNDEEIYDMPTDILPENCNISIQSVLVSTLAMTLHLHSNSCADEIDPFPGDGCDKRAELALEILYILFILQKTVQKNAESEDISTREKNNFSNNTETSSHNLLTQVGVILIDILQMTNADMRIYRLKLAVVNLLMDAPDSYLCYVYDQKVLPQIWTILILQINKVVVEEGSPGKSSDAPLIVPILAVLNKFCRAHPLVLKYCQDKIFSQSMESSASHKDINENPTKPSRNNRMGPIDAPQPGSTHDKLLTLMTWLESSVKRCASEFLWTVCEDSSEVFIKKTGFGNAVHLLSVKGILPQEMFRKDKG